MEILIALSVIFIVGMSVAVYSSYKRIRLHRQREADHFTEWSKNPYLKDDIIKQANVSAWDAVKNSVWQQLGAHLDEDAVK